MTIPNNNTEAIHLINKSEDAGAQNEEPYYGLNDPRPKQRSLTQKIGMILCGMLCLPIILVLGILFILSRVLFRILAPFKFDDSQKKAGRIMYSEFWYRRPGKRLQVISTPQGVSNVGDGTPPGASSDILISEDFFRKNNDGSQTHILDCEAGTYSLRKSIEYTVKQHLLDESSSPHAKAILADNDRDKPRFFLHGWTTPLETATTKELWTTHARTPTWAAYYSWADQLSMGKKRALKSYQCLDLEDPTVPDVLGYIYVLAMGNPCFYNTDNRIEKVLNPRSPNAPQHTPATEHRVFARYNYKAMRYIGDFPRSDPDAYIFVGRKVLDEADLKVLHRYRILKPGGER